MIKSGGEWISSVDLENELMAHPAVQEAAVIGIPDERWGERPLACVVLRSGAKADAAELAKFLGEKVARWQVPENWAFVPEIPKTARGQVRQEGAPRPGRRGRAGGRAARRVTG